MSNKKTFVYEIALKTIPYNKETCGELYGGGYNPDFPENVLASDLIGSVLNDAYCKFLQAEMKHMVECNSDIEGMTEAQRSFHKYLQNKTKVMEKIRDSLKFSRIE